MCIVQYINNQNNRLNCVNVKCNKYNEREEVLYCLTLVISCDCPLKAILRKNWIYFVQRKLKVWSGHCNTIHQLDNFQSCRQLFLLQWLDQQDFWLFLLASFLGLVASADSLLTVCWFSCQICCKIQVFNCMVNWVMFT